MIRPCTESDIPFVMELGKRFADDAGVTDQVGWNDANVEALLRVMIADHVLLRGEQSIIGGLVFPHPFSGLKVFQELFWRSEGGREGIGLLEAAESAARGLGAARSIMATMHDMPGAEKILTRRGYGPTEQTFSKEL
jgi:hypothetical protein